MSIYGICSCFIDGCGKNHSFFANVLFKFVQENVLRVAYDEPNRLVFRVYDK
jgi:hypothetical protein